MRQQIRYIDDFDVRKLAQEVTDAEPRSFIAVYIKGEDAYLLSNTKNITETIGLLMRMVVELGIRE